MVHDEPWQVYAENGSPVEGGSASRVDFKADQTLIMGASHVWIWRKNDDGVEILLQRRSLSKSTWAGYLDISAAGHVDASETPVESAVREAKEEIDIAISPKDLYYIFSLRTPLDDREFDTVYLYHLHQDVEFTFNDGEVDALIWASINDFEMMTKAPDEHNLVSQGDAYFSLLIDNIRRISA